MGKIFCLQNITKETIEFYFTECVMAYRLWESRVDDLRSLEVISKTVGFFRGVYRDPTGTHPPLTFVVVVLDG